MCIRDRNNHWDWDGNVNETWLNLGSGMNHWEREGLGSKKTFPLISSPGMRQVVGFGDRFTRRGTFGGEFGARHCNQWGLYVVYVCDSAATRPFSQITLGSLVQKCYA